MTLVTNAAYDLHRTAMNQRPIYIMELAWNDGQPGTEGVNDVYFSSADISKITAVPANIVPRFYPFLKHDSISAITEKFDEKNGTSSIGTVAFKLTDHDRMVSAVFRRAEADTNQSMRRQRTEMYLMYEGMAWADRIKIRALQIYGAKVDMKGDYEITSQSILKWLKKDIFIPETATVQTELLAGAVLPAAITLNSTAKLEMAVSHTSYHPTPVGFVKINDDIMMFTANNKNTSTLTISARGLFGSTIGDHAIGDDVQEVCVLKGNPYSLALRVLFSSGNSFVAGKAPTNGYDVYPKHWGVGLAAVDVDMAGIEAVGALKAGFTALTNESGTEYEFVYSDKEECKVFIERECFRNTGAFGRVLGSGAYSCKGLELTAQVPLDLSTGRLSHTGLAAVFDETNVVKANSASANHNRFSNSMILSYFPWPKDTSKPLRKINFFDQTAQDKHGPSNSVEYFVRGLQTDAASLAAAVIRFNDVQSRFSSPPVEMTIEVLPEYHNIEVGDVVGVDLLYIQDVFIGISRWRAGRKKLNGERILTAGGMVYVANCGGTAGGITGATQPVWGKKIVTDGTVTWVQHDGHLARAFEVVSTSLNVKTGRPTLDLISQPEEPSWAGSTFISGAPTRFADSAYQRGTALNAIGWPVSGSGVRSPAGAVTLGAVGVTTDYYYLGNITMSGTTTLTLLGTVRFWSPGKVSDEIGFKLIGRGNGGLGGKLLGPPSRPNTKLINGWWGTIGNTPSGAPGFISPGGSGGNNRYNGINLSGWGRGGKAQVGPAFRPSVHGLFTSTAKKAKTDAANLPLGSTVIPIAAGVGTGSIRKDDAIRFAGDASYYTVVSGLTNIAAGGNIVIPPGLGSAVWPFTTITPYHRLFYIAGIPLNLAGAGGGMGGAISNPSPWGVGGFGGNGSAGVAVIARDIDVSNGSYDLSGSDGRLGVIPSIPLNGQGGGGGGGGGVMLLYVEKGAIGNAPVFNPGNVTVRGGVGAKNRGWYPGFVAKPGGPGTIIAGTF